MLIEKNSQRLNIIKIFCGVATSLYSLYVLVGYIMYVSFNGPIAPFRFFDNQQISGTFWDLITVIIFICLFFMGVYCCFAKNFVFLLSLCGFLASIHAGLLLIFWLLGIYFFTGYSLINGLIIFAYEFEYVLYLAFYPAAILICLFIIKFSKMLSGGSESIAKQNNVNK